ncbi:MAG: Gfo/Idh/MocA family oxidoreductase [Chloroflexota bacterium]|nr:Gfo/Idh/MocA family oxidoreductase [Chloroflexota bacterium]
MTVTEHGERRTLRLGIIGTGLAIEKLHWPALRKMSGRLQVTAFADIARGNAERFAGYSGVPLSAYSSDYAELLARDDVDAVLIGLPIPLLYPAARAALQAGKHVLCEKPAGANELQGRDFLALDAEFPSLKILIAENFFYRPELLLARSLLDSGAIGRVHLMTWRQVLYVVPREGAFASTPWRQAPQYRGGPQLDAGVHHVAQMRMLCGDIQDLQAFLQYANPTTGGPSDMTLNIHFASNAIGSYVGAHLAVPLLDETNDMRLYGSEGVLSVGNKSVRVLGADGAIGEHTLDSDNGYFNQLVNFYESIVYGEPIVGTIAQSFANLLVIQRALDSAEGYRLVSLQDLPGGLSEHSVPLWRARAAA